MLNEDALLLSDDDATPSVETAENPDPPVAAEPAPEPDPPAPPEVHPEKPEAPATPQAIALLLEDDEEDDEPEETMAFKRLKVQPTVEPQPRPPFNPPVRHAAPPFRDFRADFQPKFRPHDIHAWPAYQQPPMMNYPAHGHVGAAPFFNGGYAPPRNRFQFYAGPRLREYRPVLMGSDMPDNRFMQNEPPRRVLINPNFKGGVEAVKSNGFFHFKFKKN